MASGESQHPELMVDFIISLDGYAAADDWPGLWGLGGPEYFAWLGADDIDFLPSVRDPIGSALRCLLPYPPRAAPTH